MYMQSLIKIVKMWSEVDEIRLVWFSMHNHKEVLANSLTFHDRIDFVQYMQW
jgi:hypothetical protein